MASLENKYGKSAVDATRRNALPPYLDTLFEGGIGGGAGVETHNVTLTTANWSNLQQNVVLTCGATDASDVVCAGDNSTMDADYYLSAFGVKLTSANVVEGEEEGVNTVTFTFTAASTPTTNINVVVIIINASTEGGVPVATTSRVGVVKPDGTTISIDSNGTIHSIGGGGGGGAVTGVKGNSESTYRTGNINITKANIGLGNVDNTSDANKKINPANITDGYTSTGFYLNTHPEAGKLLIPFINNDMAYLTKRGGTAKVYYDGVEHSANIANVFDGSPSYWGIQPSTLGFTELVIELTLPQAKGWTNTIYVDFGASNWRAKSIKIEVMNSNYANDVWTVKSNQTNYSLGEHKVTFNHTPVGATNAGGGFNKIRFTFSDFATSGDFRIACLGLLNYGSSGLRETFLPKDGGEMYGSVTPRYGASYDIGSSSNKWRNIYANSFVGTATDAHALVPTLGRPSSADPDEIGGAKLRHFYASSSMTTNKPPTGDGAIIHLPWDGNNGYDAQIAVKNTDGHLAVRGMNAKVWGSWAEVYDTRHKPSKSDVGLGNVDNTSDANKPISTATQTALDGKLDKSSGVSSVGYNTSTHKLTKTINGTTSDVATIAGIPSGGTTGQFLAKASNTNYDVQWVTVPNANGVSF